jgi:hypothetical protein
MTLICLALTPPPRLYSAPVGNPADEALWAPGYLQSTSGLSATACISIDSQINKLPQQIRRVPWLDTNSGETNARYYSQIRESKNTLNAFGVQIGIPIHNNSTVYGLIGTCKSKIDFSFQDWTIDRTFLSSYSFKSGPDLYYGVGASIIIDQNEIISEIPLTFAMDVKYRRFSLTDEKITVDSISYKCTLNEIQLAFVLSTKLDFFSPYFGFKVASMTGSETYIDKNYSTNYYPDGYIEYSDDITWSKNVGLFIGATKYFNDAFSVGIELRGGNERGTMVNATTRF